MANTTQTKEMREDIRMTIKEFFFSPSRIVFHYLFKSFRKRWTVKDNATRANNWYVGKKTGSKNFTNKP